MADHADQPQTVEQRLSELERRVAVMRELGQNVLGCQGEILAGWQRIERELAELRKLVAPLQPLFPSTEAD